MIGSRPALGLTAVALAACTAVGASPTPTPPPLTQAQAVQLVLAQDDRFAGIGPADPNVIGQGSWYEVATTSGGWQVRVRIGWGDCPAGCIEEHRWVYDVTREGRVSLAREDGDPIPAVSGVRGVVLAGPTCPVVSDPPDPQCGDRPVGGALLLVVDDAGVEVARTTSAADGTFSVLLGPGAYRLVPQPVEGLMGTAAETPFAIEIGGPMTELTVAYDTGIR